MVKYATAATFVVYSEINRGNLALATGFTACDGEGTGGTFTLNAATRIVAISLRSDGRDLL